MNLMGRVGLTTQGGLATLVLVTPIVRVVLVVHVNNSRAGSLESTAYCGGLRRIGNIDCTVSLGNTGHIDMNVPAVVAI